MTQAYLFDFLEAEKRRRDLFFGGGPDRRVALGIDPYRGCGLECEDCRGRRERGTGDGRLRECLVVRPGTAAALARALDRGRGRGRTLAIGTRGEPYPDLELEYGLTREVWRELASRKGLTILLRTRSPASRRDLDLLRATAAGNRLRVEVPLATLDGDLLAALEPDAPPPDRRLRLLEELDRAGIAAGLSISPVIPGLTDSLGELEGLVRAARRHGARFVVWSPLALRARRGVGPGRTDPGEVWLRRIGSFAPHLAARLEKSRGEGDRAAPFRGRLIATRVRELKLKYGFPATDEPFRLPTGWTAATRPAGNRQSA